jgi:RNA polymerase sigma-54 factor
MKQTLRLKTGQSLVMTPKMQQQMRLLQLSNIELQIEVQELLESNIMLEEDETEQNTKNLDSNEEQKLDTVEKYTKDLLENNAINDLDIDIAWEENFNSTPLRTKTNSENKSNSIEFEEEDSKYKTLQEHLRWQLNLIPISDSDKVIAETIIDSLNDDGLLDDSLENILETVNNDLEEVVIEEIEAVLKIIQSLDPTGVGARDLKECLSIQLKQYDPEIPEVKKAKEIIDNYFDFLEARDNKKLMKKLKLADKELMKIINFIQTMNPRPGSQINNSRTEYIMPDVVVKKENNKWKIKINKDSIPSLRINSVYKNMISRTNNVDNQTLKLHLQEASWCIKNLQNRGETLKKVTECIVEYQRDFLEHGEMAMKPLILQDIADKLGMHESTISRATTRKYMHTPRGTYELKYFFPSHVTTNDGGSCSSTAIHALIKKLIDDELPNKPLSDNKISALLKKDGINVARRTIAKYRETMTIPPSNERKRF